MNEQNPQYKPGDIANGHVLTASGQWVPMDRPTPPAAPQSKKPIYKRWWVIAIAAVFVIGIISSATGGDESTVSDDSAASSAPAADEPKAEEPAEVEEAAEPAEAEEAEPKPKYTLAQENAIAAAQNYVDIMPFSRAGLIDQLSSEYGSQFPLKDAEFAVDHIKVDWRAEAVEAAEQYLDTMAFSRQGLIDQLSSEYGSQFSVETATYAVNQVGL